MTTPTIKRNPWSWIPTLYFAEGLPYVAVMTIAVIMYKRLGLSLDYQTVMESIRRSGKNETFLDYRHARVHRRRICRHRLFYPNGTLRTIHSCFLLVIGIQFGYP